MRLAVPVRVRKAEVAVCLGPVPAGDRDVELGVAPHAVLRDVEARGLGLPVDTDPPHALERPERAERRAERERADGDQAQHLDAELVEAATVEEAGAADPD